MAKEGRETRLASSSTGATWNITCHFNKTVLLRNREWHQLALGPIKSAPRFHASLAAMARTPYSRIHIHYFRRSPKLSMSIKSDSARTTREYRIQRPSGETANDGPVGRTWPSFGNRATVNRRLDPNAMHSIVTSCPKGFNWQTPLSYIPQNMG